ncbi:uncharacterized protein BO97DRAFT_415055 [Aspergillus homomorphus CBS 101889]|uniref:RNA ligase/cyclic nucleotide phosphodiesterase n=1 Tax=Aspergillus homomorphus (strain CBS 101889) TaxID=1450537 RepID=A0A395HX79_ASPHC|nr:hypothetical protein BO97DRAFT_415055 [Aspergillus homomorphus CBS 101889]RAL11468.1 hypothetical protein BO97DRAFT_415055 [Aspergillus homomorphus CBS 101889]
MSSTIISNDNPFQPLLTTTNNNPETLQTHYTTHRTTRQKSQTTKLLAPDFHGFTIDPILRRLAGPEQEPDYVDPRNCLTVWARPPQHIRDLIRSIQTDLQDVAPDAWFMPPESLHTTVLEITHSVSAEEIEGLVRLLRGAGGGATLAEIRGLAGVKPVGLVRPMVCFDGAGVAVCFLPGITSACRGGGQGGSAQEDGAHYSYHHLRRDVFELVRGAGLPVASRYIVPSAHVTIGRFVSDRWFKGEDGGVDRERVAEFVRKVEEVNERLEGSECEWVVGGEGDPGLVVRRGRLWYGGGEDVV